ncbi:hypothetical protein AVEN_112689-1 [Araneus ventricosus]|uniref:Uncharacterized protein n=1 Tax=Araneus ventricosus TaxID=182803 RepID=A0A4Y2SYW6_ARAVE|nr:hypothetical protein AVEN_112689-1 [Araneus ventricosus]
MSLADGCICQEKSDIKTGRGDVSLRKTEATKQTSNVVPWISPKRLSAQSTNFCRQKVSMESTIKVKCEWDRVHVTTCSDFYLNDSVKLICHGMSDVLTSPRLKSAHLRS